MNHISEFSELTERIQDLLIHTRGHRPILGIVGPPGAGKSTLAQHLVSSIKNMGVNATNVPMDGFHLADTELIRLGLLRKKGAIDTFDALGYRSLLQRVRTETAAIVYAPDFSRDIEQPIAGSIPVLPTHSLVVTEGNYLLAQQEPWPEIRKLIDEIWYCDLDHGVRLERLVARHEKFGKTRTEARAWVESVDEANALEIIATRSMADLVVDLSSLGLAPQN